jgi:hypothetical protein
MQQLFIIEGQNGVIVTMSLPSRKLDGGITPGGIKIARHAIGSSLSRVVNVKNSLTMTTGLDRLILDKSV